MFELLSLLNCVKVFERQDDGKASQTVHLSPSLSENL
jgi:hypothetical protein